MRGRHRRRRIGPGFVAGLAIVVPILTGGLAGAQTDPTSGESMDFTVQSGFAITVGAMVGDGMQLRQTDFYQGISSAISQYVGENTTDVIDVSMVPMHAATQDNVAIDESKVEIKVRVTDLTCELCEAGDGPGTASAGTGYMTLPLSDRPEAVNPVTTWVTVIEGIDTGFAAAWANLDYTVRTTGAVAGTYSYTITYRIHAV